ncbi:MAG: iron-containing alcohol dehydrogenase family protein [Bacteroidota bacterium]
MFRNFKGVEKTAYGRGSFARLGEILEPHRNSGEGYLIFFVDEFFEGNEDFKKRLPLEPHDKLEYIPVKEEPTTELIDSLRDKYLLTYGLPAGVVGIGGGSVMDVAKAISLMFTNEGSSALYQGLNLVKKPGIFACGVPTVSGTGAEVSMTAVLTGPEKKLGLKCDWTVLNQIVLDPDLIATVPDNQWFYTGMDCYIHSVEAMTGHMKNTYSEAFGFKALDMCREVYLEMDRKDPKSDETLMVASYMGGLSLTYSEVGVCHALSYGLSKVLHTHHGIANCMAFNQLEDVYGDYVQEFKTMVKKHGINIPENMSADWSDETIDAMVEVAYKLDHMWNHAFGENWTEVLDRERIKNWYKRM